ncbi:MAG: hypothetical protein AB1442_13530 [Nitrospirota bacterium]
MHCKKLTGGFEVDTFEKAMNFYCALRLYRAKERLQYILSLYPELWELTHERLAELVGLERETVTKKLKVLKTKKQEDNMVLKMNSLRVAGYNSA